jgi:hypothetical protein
MATKQQVADVPQLEINTKFERWETRIRSVIEGGRRKLKPEKIRLLHDDILITPEEASILNSGVINDANIFVDGYFLPGQDKLFVLEDTNE